MAIQSSGAARYEEGIEAGEVSPAEMAEVGLTAFFAIAREWGLNREQQRRLLGSPGRSRFYSMVREHKGALSNDELDRLSYIVGIYAALNILYNPENTLRWLRHPGEPDAPWGGMSPLEYMLTGKLVALADVRRYLDALRG